MAAPLPADINDNPPPLNVSTFPGVVLPFPAFDFRDFSQQIKSLADLSKPQTPLPPNPNRYE